MEHFFRRGLQFQSEEQLYSAVFARGRVFRTRDFIVLSMSSYREAGDGTCVYGRYQINEKRKLLVLFTI